MRDRSIYVSLAGVRRRGWTDAMVRALLGAPDVQGRDPRRFSLTPVRLYLLARVEAVERTPEFVRAAAAVREGRSREGRGGGLDGLAERRRAAVLAAVRAEPIVVPRLPAAELERRAVRHRRLLTGAGGGPSGGASGGPSGRSSGGASGGAPGRSSAGSSGGLSGGSLVRWQVAYLRHALARYDTLLDGLYGDAGRREAERLLRRRVYEAIAAAYPALSEECRRRTEAER